DPQRAAVEGKGAGYVSKIGVVGHSERAGVDRPGRRRRRRTGQRPGAGAVLLKDAEAAVLRGGADVRYIEAAVDRAACLQLKHVRAAGKRDRVGAGACAAVGQSTANRAGSTHDDRNAASANANSASAPGA